MTRDEFDTFCASLPAATHVIQWGNASVWKVGGKIFAICSAWNNETEQRINFKCSDLSFTLLTQQEGIVPARYLARAKWVCVENPDALSKDDIKAYIRTAHQLIAAKLTKKARAELGLADT